MTAGTDPSPAAHWTSAGRAAAAAAFVAGGALWLLGELIDIGDDGAAHLAWMHAHPTAAGIGLTADMVGTLLLFGAAAAWYLLARRRSPRLALTGLVLLVAGLGAQLVVTGVEMTQFALVRSGAVSAVRLDAVVNGPSAMGLAGNVFQVLFFGGAFLGIVVVMVALWRARAVSRPAIVLVVAFQLAQLVGSFPATPILLAGLGWMAVDVLRAAPARDHDAVELVA